MKGLGWHGKWRRKKKKNEKDLRPLGIKKLRLVGEWDKNTAKVL